MEMYRPVRFTYTHTHIHTALLQYLEPTETTGLRLIS